MRAAAASFTFQGGCGKEEAHNHTSAASVSANKVIFTFKLFGPISDTHIHARSRTHFLLTVTEERQSRCFSWKLVAAAHTPWAAPSCPHAHNALQ